MLEMGLNLLFFDVLNQHVSLQFCWSVSKFITLNNIVLLCFVFVYAQYINLAVLCVKLCHLCRFLNPFLHQRCNITQPTLTLKAFNRSLYGVGIVRVYSICKCLFSFFIYFSVSLFLSILCLHSLLLLLCPP